MNQIKRPVHLSNLNMVYLVNALKKSVILIVEVLFKYRNFVLALLVPRDILREEK